MSIALGLEPVKEQPWLVETGRRYSIERQPIPHRTTGGAGVYGLLIVDAGLRSPPLSWTRKHHISGGKIQTETVEVHVEGIHSNPDHLRTQGHALS